MKSRKNRKSNLQGVESFKNILIFTEIEDITTVEKNRVL